MEKTSFLPKGYQAVMPSLAFKSADAAITWYKNVFGAQEKARMEGPDKKIMHAEMDINGSVIFLADDDPKYKTTTPNVTNGNSIKLYAYVPDIDNTIKKAVKDGASLVMPAEDMFYGDRVGCIDDPFGYTWVLATHIKDVSEKEMYKKMEEMAHN
ncbi:MAG TPA: VOC family protein [Chitinophagaceae bacterium]|nr:VOC family protein [Chitinophagaceae bacterium]